MKSKPLISLKISYEEGGGANQTMLLLGKCFSLVEEPPNVNFGDITSLAYNITKNTHDVKQSFTKKKNIGKQDLK